MALPERKKRPPMMPPPGMAKKPAAVIAIGIGPKKPDEDKDPSDNPPPSPMDAPKGALGPPSPAKPTGDGGPTSDSEEGDADDAGKMTPEEAIVIRADDGKTCQHCANYQGESGLCSVVPGQFMPDDRCLRGFEPMDSDEASEQGEGAEASEPEPAMAGAGPQ